MRSRRWRAFGLVVLLGSVGPAVLTTAAHAAHVTCGQVITQNTVLDSDVGPCPGTGIVVGASDITLDLGGHTIFATPSNTSAGVFVHTPQPLRPTNVRVRVRNGTVAGFRAGISVVQSFDNTFERLVLRENCHGIELEGIGSGTYWPAARNSVRENVITANRCSGVHLFKRADANTVERNLVSRNAGSGVLLEPLGINNSPRTNTVRQNSIEANGGNGIEDRSSFNTHSGNLVRGNGGDGIHLTADLASGFTQVRSNQVLQNGGSGVLVQRLRENNQLVGNTATGNAAVDLVDLNLNCDNNAWSGNSFGTRNQPCIT